MRHVVVYGSRAKGSHRAGSDIDLCVYDTIENQELSDHIDRAGVSFYQAPLGLRYECRRDEAIGGDAPQLLISGTRYQYRR